MWWLKTSVFVIEIMRLIFKVQIIIIARLQPIFSRSYVIFIKVSKFLLDLYTC